MFKLVLSKEEILDIEERHFAHPEERIAQKALAKEVIIGHVIPPYIF